MQEFDGYCYEVVGDSALVRDGNRMVFTEALAYCRQELGRDLVSVHSKRESAFLITLLGSEGVWIGLTDRHDGNR